MKRFTAFVMALVMALSLVGCSGAAGTSSAPGAPAASSQPPAEESIPASQAESTSGTPGGKTLVVYYSATGNTEQAANYIAQVKRRYSLPKGFRFSATLWRCGVCTALAHLLCFLGLCADGPAPWPALGNGCGLGAKNSRARFTQAGQIGAVRRGHCHCRIWGICVLEKRHWLLFVFVFFLCVF